MEYYETIFDENTPLEEIFVNVYVYAYYEFGYPHKTKEDAIKISKDGDIPIYRIHVIPK